MNGFSLLFAFAALGITAQIEVGPTTGQPTYTIRIESPLLDELRQGQEIRTNVAAADRGARYFRILMAPDANGRAAGSVRSGDFAASADSLVEYEAVQMANNEVELWVQVSPERVETLAAGRAIEGAIPLEVREIHRYRIFVGVNLLPRQQTAAPPQDTPPYLLPGNDRGLAPAAAEDRNNIDPRFGPLVRNSSTGSAGMVGSNGGVNSGLGLPPANDVRTAWRNGPDQSSAPPPGDRLGPLNGTGLGGTGLGGTGLGGTGLGGNGLNTNGNYATAGAPPYGTAPGGFVGDNRSGAGNTRLDSSFSQPAYNGQSPPGYANNYGAPPFAQNGAAANAVTNGYAPPQATLASRPETPPLQTPPVNSAVPPTNWVPPATSQPAPSAGSPASSPVVEEPKSSVPLILTTLALFTSLGVNSYLGWLAWSFFWRYRDAVNESFRARSYNAPGRQAA